MAELRQGMSLNTNKTKRLQFYIIKIWRITQESTVKSPLKLRKLSAFPSNKLHKGLNKVSSEDKSITE